MANHASAIKRIRSCETKRIRHRYQHKTTKSFIKGILKLKDAREFTEKIKKASSMLDKLAKRKIIHPNKSARKKSQLATYLHQLQQKQ